MTSKQAILVVLIGWSFLTFTLFLVQRHRFRERYAILWIFVGLLYMAVPLFHDFAAYVGRLIGFEDSVSFILFSGIMALSLLSIQFTLALTVAFNQRKAFIQRVAILEKRIHDLEMKLWDREPRSQPPAN